MNTVPHTLLHAARNPEITRAGLKVLTVLHEKLNTVDFRPVLAWSVAEQLHCDRSQVQRALTHLLEIGYLERQQRPEQGQGFVQSFAFRLALPEKNGHTPPPALAA